MISFQPRNHAVDQARRAAVRRVADWVEEALPEEQRDATHVMVNQVECREEGCPARIVDCTLLSQACGARFGDIWRKGKLVSTDGVFSLCWLG